MKLLFSGLFFVFSFFCFQSQAMEVDHYYGSADHTSNQTVTSEDIDDYDEPEYTSNRTITIEELESTLGKENVAEVIKWAPRLDFMEDDKVFMYAVGHQRISAKIASLERRDQNQRAHELMKLIDPQQLILKPVVQKQEVYELLQLFRLLRLDSN